MINRLIGNRFGRGRSAGQAGGGGAGRGMGGPGQGGGGQGGGNKPGSGPGGNCICPKCGKKVPHIAGQRCFDQVCPDCGTQMIRE